MKNKTYSNNDSLWITGLGATISKVWSWRDEFQDSRNIERLEKWKIKMKILGRDA